MGRAEAALIANESYQDLAAARVIVEASGGKIYKLDGSEFFLNEYLDGQRIADPLMVTTPAIYSQVRESIQSNY
jgi:myo-inositol-1(or 4)-monophosphatase